MITLGTISLVVLLGFFAFFQRHFNTIQVQGESMEPTFAPGTRLLASNAYWLVGAIRPNDIVVVSGEEPGQYFIKRIYRMEGGVVDWLNIPDSHNMGDGEYIVPPDTVYVLGDNREVSEDSRRFGAVPVQRILGKIVMRQWL